MKPRILLLATALGLFGCEAEGWGPDALSHGSGDGDDETLALGRSSYELYCSGCHGLAGDGQGPAAIYLEPKPRDFRVGLIKFAQVPAGQAPRAEDYLRVINHGLNGSAMPAFALIPDHEKRALVAYVRSISDKVLRPGDAIAVPRDPYAKKPALGVRKGEALYHGLAQCNSCHPSYASKDKILEHRKTFELKDTSFRDNMYASVVKDSDWGAPILPPDFLVDRVKTGSSKEELVIVIAAGITGTAMPSWGTSLKPRQLWALAYYVESIAALRGMPEGSALHRQLLEGESTK